MLSALCLYVNGVVVSTLFSFPPPNILFGFCPLGKRVFDFSFVVLSRSFQSENILYPTLGLPRTNRKTRKSPIIKVTYVCILTLIYRGFLCYTSARGSNGVGCGLWWKAEKSNKALRNRIGRAPKRSPFEIRRQSRHKTRDSLTLSRLFFYL